MIGPMSDIKSIKQRFGIIGVSPLLDRALEKAVQVAPTDISVLVTGESGVGKESIPKIIHALSHRKHNPYIAVNCGAIPEGTIDSELFGHEKGAFTGAAQRREGRFEQANGGTLFLDEIGDMPSEAQTRLLRVLADGEFYRVGGHTAVKVDVRIIAATHQNLETLVTENRFREDLFHRINVFEINIEPLSQRISDIPLLIKYFSKKIAENYNIKELEIDENNSYILNHNWKGNVRELRNLIERIAILQPDTKDKISNIIKESLKIDNFEDQIAENSLSVPLKEAREKFEKEYLTIQLKKFNGNISKTANFVGMERSALHRKLKGLGIKEFN